MDKEEINLNGDKAALVQSVFSGESATQLGSSGVNGQIVSIQEDLEVLKTEIKQTLIDLREVVMKDRTVFPNHTKPLESAQMQPAVMLDLDNKARSDAEHLLGFVSRPEVKKEEFKGRSTLREMGEVFQWILDIKEAGLSPTVLARFLEEYANSDGISTEAGELAMFVVKIIEDMKTDGFKQTTPISLDTYGLYIGKLGHLLARADGSESPYQEPELIRREDDGCLEPGLNTSRGIAPVEDNDGQSNSHSIVDDSFDHGCSHCYEWHDSGHK